MKLIYKGKFEDYDSLPKADLPKNAIKFDEPETIEGIVQEAKRYFVPLLVIIGDVIIFFGACFRAIFDLAFSCGT